MDTNEKFVITLSREIGSGGRTIGKKLAEKLGVPFCDKAVIRGLVDHFDLSAYNIEKIKGEKKNWLSDFIQKIAPVPQAENFLDEDSRYVMDYHETISTKDIFKVESQIIKDLADEGSCVIAGRSGFFILEGYPNKVDIFITSSREKRIERIMRKQELPREQAEEVLDSVDQMRENYIKRFTTKSRYDVRNYDLAINVDSLTEDAAVDCILQFIKTCNK